VVRNQSNELDYMVVSNLEIIEKLVSDFELIIVDNASEDNSVATLKKLTCNEETPNLQIYALTKEVDQDTASWVGLENALGDFVAVIDPLTYHIGFLPVMLDKAVSGADVVFANNEQKTVQSLT